jgi:DNA-binding FrmR family transcriptional regulator
MSVRSRQKLLARIGRMRGQVDAVERALLNEAGCEQVMHLIAGVRGAMSGLLSELVEDHVRSFLVEPGGAAVARDAAEELIEVVHTYLK